MLKNVTVAAGARIAAFCHLENAVVGPDCIIGPYARLRPGAELGAEVHIGNFVEVKNTTIAAKSKANHLACRRRAYWRARQCSAPAPSPAITTA